MRCWPMSFGLRLRFTAEYLGRSLEDWYRRRFLEFAGLSPVGAWWDRRGENEVDLIALDKSGKRIIFAEVKTRASKLDEAKLRQKAKAFF